MAKEQKKEQNSEDLMTAKAVAKFLNISRQRVGQLRVQGKLKAVQVGIWLYRREDVEKAKKTLHFNSKREEPCADSS